MHDSHVRRSACRSQSLLRKAKLASHELFEILKSAVISNVFHSIQFIIMCSSELRGRVKYIYVCKNHDQPLCYHSASALRCMYSIARRFRDSFIRDSPAHSTDSLTCSTMTNAIAHLPQASHCSHASIDDLQISQFIMYR